MEEIKINLEDVKEQIIERTAEILAERLLKEIKKDEGNVPYIPPLPRYPMDMQPVMYGCPVTHPSVLDNPFKFETISSKVINTMESNEIWYELLRTINPILPPYDIFDKYKDNPKEFIDYIIKENPDKKEEINEIIKQMNLKLFQNSQIKEIE